MRKTKKRLEPFAFFNMSAITAHLEKMAAKGWMIDKIINSGWVYRKIEPKKLRFAVSYYPKASEYDPEPSEEQREFHEFCAHTGWNLACTCAQMQIFYNEQEDPILIETEPALELGAIHASARKTFIPTYAVLFVIGCFYSFFGLMGFLGNPIATLANPSQPVLFVCSVGLILLCTVELILYYRWYDKAQIAAENGVFLSPPDTAAFEKVILVIVAIVYGYWFLENLIVGDNMRKFIMLAMCVYMPALFALVNGTKELLKRRKASKGVNKTLTTLASFLISFTIMGFIIGVTLWANSRGLFDIGAETYEHRGQTMVVHQDELPLSLEDLMDVDGENYTRERSGNESFLLGHLKLKQRVRYDVENWSEEPTLEYTLTIVKMPSLYDMCKWRLIREQEDLHQMVRHRYMPEDAAPWGAEDAYRLEDPEYGLENNYLLCYENVLVVIEFDWEPTDLQKQTVGQKLAG